MTVKGEEDSVNTYADILRFPRVKLFAEAGSRLTQMFTVIFYVFYELG